MLMGFLHPCFMAYKALELNFATMYPIIGENTMLIKKDHSTPIFFSFPSVSEIINEREYHAININVIQYTFIG